MSKYGYINRLFLLATALAAGLGAYFFANALYLKSRDGGSGQQVVFALVSFALAAALFALHYRLSWYESSEAMSMGRLLREAVFWLIALALVVVAVVNVRLLLCVLPLVGVGFLLFVVLALAAQWQRFGSRYDGSDG